MALTIAHPAAAGFFRGLVRRGVVDLPALVVGTMAPNFAYYLARPSLGELAHSGVGMVIAAIPLGLVALIFYHLFRRPVFFTMPNPHRIGLAESPSLNRLPRGPGDAAAVVVGLGLGIATHLLWDMGTEAAGWLVKVIPSMREGFYLPSWSPLQGALPGYFVLKIVSSVVGLGFLAFIYRDWLRSHLKGLSHPYQAREFDRWRLVFWFLALLLPAVFALPRSLPLLTESPDFFRAGLFAHHWIVTYMATFVPLLLCGSTTIYLVWWFRCQRAAGGDRDQG